MRSPLITGNESSGRLDSPDQALVQFYNRRFWHPFISYSEISCLEVF